MKLTFLGATGTVTGSKYLVESPQTRVLVDCGLFQGLKELRLRNWERLTVDARTIDAVVLTHAHIDHSGYLPALVKQGFSGPIFCSEATGDLLKILLPDSAKLQEEEAQYANKRGYSKHKPAKALFAYEDAVKALEQIKPVPIHSLTAISPEVGFELIPSGHILGSTFVKISSGGSSILFSGDLGRPKDLLMNPPEVIKEADYLVVESTYGNRLHPTGDPFGEIAGLIHKAVEQKGVVLVPAFSVGRTQELLYVLYRLTREGKIPRIPVFLDSPMSIKATGIFCDHQGEHRLNVEECQGTCEIARYVRTPMESKGIMMHAPPMVIISASGMMTGGRILHHLRHFGPDPKNSILLMGYQAAGTRGRRLADGERTIKIFGETVEVRAEIKKLDYFSAHADQSEILGWLKGFRSPPKKTFITHGEPEPAQGLKKMIESTLKWPCVIPTYLEGYDLHD